MRAFITSSVVIVGLFAASGAYAADFMMPLPVDWDVWGNWWREAAGSLPG